MIFNMSGGGTSLNFKVVGNPQPASPKENIIWVNTNIPISSYHFGNEEPLVSDGNELTLALQHDGVYGTLDGSIVEDSNYTTKIFHIPTGARKVCIRIDNYSASNASHTFFDKDSVPVSPFPRQAGYAFIDVPDNAAYVVLAVRNSETVSVTGAYAEEGTVWISTSTSSTAPFNPLKKNNITVYPMSAKQYVNGAWVNKTAKTYQGGKWVDWIVYVVPSNTFSWFTNNTVRGNVTKNNDNSVTVNCTSTNYYVMAFTKETFDLTGFNKMIVTYTSTSGYTMAAIGVATSTTGTEAYNEYIAYTKVNRTSTPVTATINISNINRPVYFGATEFNGSITIKEIRLEV